MYAVGYLFPSSSIGMSQKRVSAKVDSAFDNGLYKLLSCGGSIDNEKSKKQAAHPVAVKDYYTECVQSYQQSYS